MTNVLPPSRTLAQWVPLLNALACGAALVDRDGTIQHVNARLAEMMRRPTDELIGANLVRLCSSDDEKAAVRASLAHFDTAREEETFLPLPDGTRLPVVSCAKPVRCGSPPEDLRLVTMIDISAQKLAEKRLRDQYALIVEISNTVLEQAVELKEYSGRLEKRVHERTLELHEANVDAMHMLAVASEAKDADTGEHVLRIQKLAETLAIKMGIPETEARAIGQAAILHDVGKIHVPDAILEKPGPLSEVQRTRMQTH
ncbi:MAG: PAS domain-containing protein, partial [Phycisphaerae bacterium]|nr:PAS domain-containing protein [Phycisphaerae bacterium]